MELIRIYFKISPLVLIHETFKEKTKQIDEQFRFH